MFHAAIDVRIEETNICSKMIRFVQLTIILSLTTSWNMAQRMEKYETIMVVNEDSLTRNFVLSSREKPLIGFSNRDYYWFRANKVLKTRGGQGGKLLHGEYLEYHLNKNLKTKGRVRGGLKVGRWIHWHDNGMIAEVEKYRLGLLHGKSKKYSRNGLLTKRIKYKRGRMHGKTRIYENGEPVGYEKYRRGICVKPSIMEPKETDVELKDDRNESLEKEGKTQIIQRIKKMKSINRNEK